MEAQNEVLAKMYETIRYQQEVVFQLATRIQALQMALTTRDGFAEVHAAALTEAATPERVRQHAALIAALSLEIAHLRGENLTIGQA